MAYQNAFIRKSRALLLVLMIGLSMAIMIGLEGLYDGMSEHMIDKTKRSDCGDLALFAQKYRIEKSINLNILNAEKKVLLLKKLAGVQEAIWRIQTNGLAQTAHKSRPARLIGIDIKKEEQFGRFNDFLQKGKLHFGKDGLFIGSVLAEKLKVKLGSKLIFSMQDSKHQLQSVAFHIKAIMHTTNAALDTQGLFMPREKLNHLLLLQKNTATQIAVRGQSISTTLLQHNVKKVFPNLNVQHFAQLYPQLKGKQVLIKEFNRISFFIVMGVVFIGILGVMYVSILDRVREFGILLSIGYAYRYIRAQVLIEAIVLGITGYILGAFLGLVFLEYLQNYGLDLSIFSAGMNMFGLDSTLYASIKISYFTHTFFAIIIAAIFSVILPLRKIKTLNPIEVIRSIG